MSDAEAKINLGPMPGEDRVREILAKSNDWKLLCTDYQEGYSRVIFYLETKIPRWFMNADKEKVTMKYLACVWATYEIMKQSPDRLAKEILDLATAELREAVRCATKK